MVLFKLTKYFFFNPLKGSITFHIEKLETREKRSKMKEQIAVLIVRA